jgi:hypothetical protein
LYKFESSSSNDESSLNGIGPAVLEKMILKKNSDWYIFTFLLLSPLPNDQTVNYLKKLESPSPRDDLDQVWLKLAMWFWRRRFFCIFQCILTFSLLSPLGNDQWSSYEQI